MACLFSFLFFIVLFWVCQLGSREHCTTRPLSVCVCLEFWMGRGGPVGREGKEGEPEAESGAEPLGMLFYFVDIFILAYMI